MQDNHQKLDQLFEKDKGFGTCSETASKPLRNMFYFVWLVGFILKSIYRIYNIWIALFCASHHLFNGLEESTPDWEKQTLVSQGFPMWWVQLFALKPTSWYVRYMKFMSLLRPHESHWSSISFHCHFPISLLSNRKTWICWRFFLFFPNGKSIMTGESILGRGYAIDPHGCSLNAQKVLMLSLWWFVS